jgi:dCTP deaminase
MFLARDRIAQLNLGEKPLFYDGTFHEPCLQQASYDLRLGTQAYLVGEDTPVCLTEQEPYLTIPPGQFALLTCFEKLDVPRNILAFITLKNSVKVQGLVNISGFHVDPTFKGTLIFAVNNAGPSDIRLKLKEPTFTIFFSQVVGDIVHDRKEQANPLEGLPLGVVQYLGGSSVTLNKLHKEIEDLRTKLLIYGPLIGAALIALFLNLLRKP